MPTFYLIAGPNGAGKTTFAKTFLPHYADCRKFLNADMIAAGLSPFDVDSAAVQAGRLLIQGMQATIKSEASFALETTLSGRGYVRQIHEMKAKGYRIVLFFLWISSAELAVTRVAQRVQQGGHNIPDEIIRRRYRAVVQNFFDLYKDLADEWYMIDNTQAQYKKIASHKGVIDRPLFQFINEQSHGD